MKSPFDGYRVYNGCPDSTLQRRLDEVKKLENSVNQYLAQSASSRHVLSQQVVAYIDANGRPELITTVMVVTESDGVVS